MLRDHIEKTLRFSIDTLLAKGFSDHEVLRDVERFMGSKYVPYSRDYINQRNDRR